jgi:hypothetical protein
MMQKKEVKTEQFNEIQLSNFQKARIFETAKTILIMNIILRMYY